METNSKFKFQDAYNVESMDFSSFTAYQEFTATTDKAGTNLNTVLGMAGEVGEILDKVMGLTFKDQVGDIDDTLGAMILPSLNCEKLKKATRVDHLEAIQWDHLSQERREAIASEAAVLTARTVEPTPPLALIKL